MILLRTFAVLGSVACALLLAACSTAPVPDRPGPEAPVAIEVGGARGREFLRAMVHASAAGLGADEVGSAAPSTEAIRGLGGSCARRLYAGVIKGAGEPSQGVQDVAEEVDFFWIKGEKRWPKVARHVSTLATR